MVLLPAILVPTVTLVLLGLGAALLLRRRHQQQLNKLRSEPVSSRGSQVSDKPTGTVVTEAGVSYSPSNMSSTRRSSKDGKPPGSSCTVSATDGGELRIDVEQLGQAGVNGHSWHGTPRGVLHFTPPSPSLGQGMPTSPCSDRARFYGFFPVIEGLPVGAAGSSNGNLALAFEQRALGSSSGSSQGMCSSSVCSSQVKARISGGSSDQSGKQQQQQPQQQVRTPNFAAAPVGKPTPLPSVSGTAVAGSVSSTANLASTVATGLEKWRIAVSTTTLQLAERRLAEQQASAMSIGGLQQQSGNADALAAKALQQAAAASSLSSSRSKSKSSETPPSPQQQAQQQQRRSTPGKPQSSDAQTGYVSSDRSTASNSTALVLKRVLGRGSFGQVWLGVWRGISVAVKIMHLPTSVLLDQQDEHPQNQQPHVTDASTLPPHFAVMEAVLSSQCSHPNVGCWLVCLRCTPQLLLQHIAWPTYVQPVNDTLREHTRRAAYVSVTCSAMYTVWTWLRNVDILPCCLFLCCR